jgi:N-acetylmuramoyl-L-alanine amidase
MRILGPASSDYTSVLNLSLGNSTGLEWPAMFDAVWIAADLYGVDPVGAVAQCAHETGFGKFGGAIDARWCNTAGIKIRHLGESGMPTGDAPLAHQMFPNWVVGARAQIQHLLAYAGQSVPPDELVDPRFGLVASGRPWCETFEQLSGHWSPKPDYGTNIVNLAKRLGYSHA